MGDKYSLVVLINQIHFYSIDSLQQRLKIQCCTILCIVFKFSSTPPSATNPLDICLEEAVKNSPKNCPIPFHKNWFPLGPITLIH